MFFQQREYFVVNIGLVYWVYLIEVSILLQHYLNLQKNYRLNTRVAWYWNPPISLLNIHQYQLTAALLFSSMASQNFWFINQFFRYLKLFFFHFQPTPNRWPSMRCTTSRAPPTAPSTAAGLPTVSQKNFFKKLFHTLVPFRRSGSSRIKDTHLLGNFFK